VNSRILFLEIRVGNGSSFFEEKIVVEEFYCEQGVIDRKILKWDGRPIEDNHEQSHYNDPRRRASQNLSARKRYQINKLAA
jgi:hypothetical protein